MKCSIFTSHELFCMYYVIQKLSSDQRKVDRELMEEYQVSENQQDPENQQKYIKENAPSRDISKLMIHIQRWSLCFQRPQIFIFN